MEIHISRNTGYFFTENQLSPGSVRKLQNGDNAIQLTGRYSYYSN